MRTIFALAARSQIITAVAVITNIHKQNSKTYEPHSAYVRIMHRLTILINLLMAIYMLGVIGIYVCPLILYKLYGTRQLILPMYFPWMSLESDIDYWINIMYQAWMLPCGGAFYAYFDILFVILTMHVNLMNDILCEKVRALNDIITAKKPSQIGITLNLRNLILLQEELNG